MYVHLHFGNLYAGFYTLILLDTKIVIQFRLLRYTALRGDLYGKPNENTIHNESTDKSGNGYRV
jgi:hypothetical protein